MNRRELIRAGLVAGVAGAALSACGADKDGRYGGIGHGERKKLLKGFSVNLEMWWTELPLEQRFELAALAGFTQVEIWFVSSANLNANELAKMAKAAGVKVTQIVGASSKLGAPYGRDIFLTSMKSAIEEAKILGAPVVTITGHEIIENQSNELSIENYRHNLEAAAPLFEEAKIFAAVEPFNPYDHPGHFINGHKDALNMVRVIGSDYVKINWDLFHMQRAEGNVIASLREGIDQVCYMQLADSPGRNQPGTGEMDYVNIISAARAAGYTGPIGLECVPKDNNNDQAVIDMLVLSERVAAAAQV
ncbi:TIM barrel protein [Robiginitomaculum antarcticum]|uniref:TIM barrel protein n=1 Tax=Robiginitomaculum antarcticum TaxID=437507 RepID=UPI00036FF38E|nr:TIM barrel protein [Robiginitomaculum antarcticum]